MPAAPDMSAFAVWKQGGSNVEASAKMLKMIEYLKEWESTGDKTIVYSQCKRTLLVISSKSEDIDTGVG